MRPDRVPRTARLAIAEALADCARVLLAEGSRDEISTRLGALGRAAGVDIVAVGRNRDGPAGESIVMADYWVDIDVTAGDDRPSHWDTVAWSRLPSFRDRLTAGRMNRFSSLDEVDARERRVFEESPAHIRAEIEIPIMDGRRWIGHVLLADREPGRRWTDEEVRLLRSLADMFSSNWARQEALEQRDRSLAIERALLECSEVLLRSDVERPVERAVQAIRDAIGCHAAFVDEHVDQASGPVLRTLHATTSDGADADAALTTIPWSRWPGAFESLAAGRSYSFGSPEELTGADRAFLESRAIRVQSEINCPIVIDGALAGVVGVSDDSPRRWTESEHRMIAATARMIGAYWHRERVRRRLEELIRTKDQFVASVSHELRTPLAVVMGLAAELHDGAGDFTPDQTLDLIGLIARESAEAAAIVEDLLVAARIDDDRIAVVSEPTDMTETVAGVIHALPPTKDAAVRSSLRPGVMARADPMRVRQVVRNLVLNAQRHGGPDILVEVKTAERQAVVSVSDDGPGIAPDVADSVFDAYSSNPGRSALTTSIGLGLSVSRNLARLMDGDVVHSRRDGRTVFELRLPIWQGG